VNYHYRTRDDLVQQAVQTELERFLAEWPERWGGLGESPRGGYARRCSPTRLLSESPHLAVIWLQQSMQPAGSARRRPHAATGALLLHLLRPLSAAATEDVLRMRAWLLANGMAVQFLRGVRREWYDRSAEWSRFIDQLLAAVEETGS
jgi:AcrR family transcriptional regulator